MCDKNLWAILDKGHPDATVTKIVVIGTVAEYSTACDGGSELAVYFHWQLFLPLREFPTQSVVLDMTPGGLDGTTGILMASTQNALQPHYSDPNILTHEVAVTSSSQITVQGLVDKLISKGLTRYMFNGQGMGCRWWCEVVMQMLEDDGYVEEGTVADLDRWWLITTVGDPRVPSTKIKGSFY
jgi:hypothetical protein